MATKRVARKEDSMKWGKTLVGVATMLGLAAGVAIAAQVSGPIPGKVNVIKGLKVAKVVSKAKAIDPDTYALPTAGGVEDPTLVGASLTFADLGLAGGSVSYLLDATGWKGLGNPPGSGGYKYKGKDDIFDPNPKGTCKIVLVKDKVIKAVCKGTTVTLTTPFAGNASMVLGIPAGSAAIEYCTEFGGTTAKNDSTILKRKDAPPPFACP